ncbi:MAG: hypothetical protein JSS12_07220 [Verrucomicrobia bacterium]|nr:hypothetical protein [Verrucomicrobiota bacterium]
MYGAYDSLADRSSNPAIEARREKYSTFLYLIEKATALSFREMHSLARLLPDWIHHLSYQQIESALQSFTLGRFIPFLQKSYKEAFGEVCRQAYLHGQLYHFLRDVAIDEETREVIKEEVKAEVLETTKPRLFSKQLRLAVQLDREPDINNVHLVDTIVAEAVVEAACKKMSHPLEELKNHEEIHQLATKAIMQCLEHTHGDSKLTVAIPKARGRGEINLVYDMASFILANE